MKKILTTKYERVISNGIDNLEKIEMTPENYGSFRQNCERLAEQLEEIQGEAKAKGLSKKIFKTVDILHLELDLSYLSIDFGTSCFDKMRGGEY